MEIVKNECRRCIDLRCSGMYQYYEHFVYIFFDYKTNIETCAKFGIGQIRTRNRFTVNAAIRIRCKFTAVKSLLWNNISISELWQLIFAHVHS
jgi:hypothetical protein